LWVAGSALGDPSSIDSEATVITATPSAITPFHSGMTEGSMVKLPVSFVDEAKTPHLYTRLLTQRKEQQLDEEIGCLIG
jgi:hypothetical protein